MRHRAFRATWITTGLIVCAALETAVGANRPFDHLRFLVLAYGAVAIVLTVGLAGLYWLRWVAWRATDSRRSMVHPLEVTGMGYSYILLITVEMTRITQRIHHPFTTYATPVATISLTLALIWLDRITTRQLDHFPTR